MKSPSQLPNRPSPPKSDRKFITEDFPLYVKKLTDDYQDTILISKAWPVIEKVLIASQWELNTDAACQAVKTIMTNFLLLRLQGELDIKTAQDQK